jgi:hypothetical protein
MKTCKRATKGGLGSSHKSNNLFATTTMPLGQLSTTSHNDHKQDSGGVDFSRDDHNWVREGEESTTAEKRWY